jgi:hypothetical protein
VVFGLEQELIVQVVYLRVSCWPWQLLLAVPTHQHVGAHESSGPAHSLEAVDEHTPSSATSMVHEPLHQSKVGADVAISSIIHTHTQAVELRIRDGCQHACIVRRTHHVCDT